ncbi:MAG: hypothetical protein EUB_02251 [Eubacterium sp.]|uniref:hypothetical protein n=1 Tax=Eubacterium sp. TaxID=142586 RepID=UPI00304D191A
MYQKLIYNKTYPKLKFEDLDPTLEDTAEDFDAVTEHVEEESADNSSAATSLSKDVFKMLNKGVVFTPLPEREPITKKFIDTVIDISESYQMDAEIRQGGGMITAMFFFDSGAAMGFLKSAIRYADDIAFITNIRGHEIAMCLDFYTHAAYRNGRRVRP